MGKKNKSKKKRGKTTISKGTQHNILIKDTDDEDSSAETEQTTQTTHSTSTPSEAPTSEAPSEAPTPSEATPTPIESSPTPSEFVNPKKENEKPQEINEIKETTQTEISKSEETQQSVNSEESSNKLRIDTSAIIDKEGPKTSPATLFKNISFIIDNIDEISKLPEEKILSPTIKFVSKYKDFISMADDAGLKTETLDLIKKDLERISVLCQSNELSKNEQDEFLMKILDLMELSHKVQSEIHEYEQNEMNPTMISESQEQLIQEEEEMENGSHYDKEDSIVFETEDKEKLKYVISSLISENRLLKEDLDSANEKIEYFQIRELESAMAREQEIKKETEEEEEEEEESSNQNKVTLNITKEAEESDEEAEEEEEEEDNENEVRSLSLLSKEEIIAKFLSLSKTNERLLGKLVVHSPRAEKNDNHLLEIQLLNNKIKDLENEKNNLQEKLQRNSEESSIEIQDLKSNSQKESEKYITEIQELKKSLEKESEKSTQEIRDLKKKSKEKKVNLEKKLEEAITQKTEIEKQLISFKEKFEELEKQKKATDGDLEVLRLFTNSDYKGQPQIKKLFEDFTTLTKIKIKSQLDQILENIPTIVEKLKEKETGDNLADQLSQLQEQIKVASISFEAVEVIFIEAKVSIEEAQKKSATLQKELDLIKENKEKEKEKEKKSPAPEKKDVSMKDLKNTEWRPSQHKSRTSLSTLFIPPEDKDKLDGQEQLDSSIPVATPLIIAPEIKVDFKEEKEPSKELKEARDSKEFKEKSHQIIKRSSSELKKVLTPEEERIKRVIILQRLWREKLKKRESIRYHIAMEILDTETNYVNHLRALRECMDLFKEKIGNIINQETFDEIFPAILPIIEVNEPILVSLKERIDKWETSRRVADIFESNVKKLAIYTHYVNNYNKALTALHNAQKNPAFVQFSQELQNKKLYRLSISDILIEPIQRIPRYVLLLEQILKKTSKSHPDYHHLRTAIDALKSTAGEINKKKAVIEFQERIVNFPQQLGELVQDERIVEYEGDLLEKTNTGYKPRKIIMFNDMIIGTKEGALMTKVSGTSKISVTTLEFKWAFFFPVSSLDAAHKTEKSGGVEYFPMILSGVSDKPNEKKTLATLNEKDRQHWSDHFKKTRETAALATARTANSDWMAISRQNSKKNGPLFKRVPDRRPENRFSVSSELSDRKDSIKEKDRDKEKEKEKEKEKDKKRQSEIFLSSDSTATV